MRGQKSRTDAARGGANWCETSPMKKLVAVLVIALVVAAALSGWFCGYS